MQTYFGLLFVLVFVGNAEATPTNYVFYGSRPLVIVTAKGEFVPLSEADLGRFDDETGRESINKRMAQRVRQLWVYSPSGAPVRVSASIKADYVGCDRSLVIETEYADSKDLLSTRPIRSTPFGLPDIEQGAMLEQGKRLLARALQEIELTPEWIAELLESATITPVRGHANEAPILVITANGEREQRTLTAFLSASLAKGGRYAVSDKTIAFGGASDSDGYAGSWELGLHVDLNGDGAEELLVLRTGYESFSAVLMQWDGKTWREVASNGGGC